MSRKDFELIARTIKDMVPMRADEHTRLLVAASFADALRATNPRFNRNRFLTACGVVEA